MTTTRVGHLSPMFRAVVNPWQRLLWDVRRRGFEHLPRRGPAILAPNHLSFIDSMLLMLSVDREIAFVGKAEYMREWPSRWLFPALGMIPVDRSGGAAAEEALHKASQVLERGHLFGIFPEGTRTRDGYLHRGRTGAARLAVWTGAPLFPVGIRGTDRIQPIGAPMPRLFVGCSITVGPPIDVKRHLTHTPPHLRLRAITDELMYEISLLSRQTYVDRYGESNARGVARESRETRVTEHEAVCATGRSGRIAADARAANDANDANDAADFVASVCRSSQVVDSEDEPSPADRNEREPCVLNQVNAMRGEELAEALQRH